MRAAISDAGKPSTARPLMKYPKNDDEIEDPSPRLPAELARQIAPIILRTVVLVRKSHGGDVAVLANAADEINDLLIPRRLRETHDNIESLRRALDEDADTALAYAHYIYKTAGPEYGRMLLVWHRKIAERLRSSEKRSAVETEWWERQADANPASPVTAPPVPTRAPRTPTALRIDEFIHGVYQAKKVKIYKTDIWLEAGYHSDREFRSFQAEQKLPSGIVAKFNSVLRITPKEFIRNRARNREAYAAYRKEKGAR
jgi:hypothetical protein